MQRYQVCLYSAARTLAMWSVGLRALPEVEHSAAEVADMLRVHFAEVAKVVLAHKVCCSLLHSLDVQVTVIRNVVLVLPPTCTEPAIRFSFEDGLQQQRSIQASALRLGFHLRMSICMRLRLFV